MTGCKDGKDAMKDSEDREQSGWDYYPGYAESGGPSSETEVQALQAVEFSMQGYQISKREAARAWTAIVSGSVVGILVVAVAILALQLQSRTHQMAAAYMNNQSTLGGSSNSSTSTSIISGSALPPAPVVGRTPPDFTLQTSDGQTITLSEMRGRPVWINFWATWCPPCRAEMPEMEQKYAQFKDKGLVILGVDAGESVEQVKSFTASRGFDWTFVLDDTREVSGQYAVGGIPTHIFIGKDGIIKAIQVGGIPATMMDRYVSSIVDN